MKNNAKKYLVTFEESYMPSDKVEEVLGLGKRNYQEGVSFLASDKEPQDDDVLSFEEVGIASLTLTQTELAKLKKNKNIMAVEEDIEMSILEVEDAVLDETDIDFMEDIDSMIDHGHNGDLDTYDEFAFNGDLDSYMEQDAYPYENLPLAAPEINLYQQGAKEMMRFVLKSLASSDIAEDPSYYQEDTQALPLPRPPFYRYPFPIPRFPLRPLPRPRPQPTPWNINLVRAPQAWRRGITGRGVKVAVLDTGIARHPDLTIRGGVSFIPGVTSYNDGHSHGTHCAGIIAARNNFRGVVGVAPDASLYAVKVLSDSGSGRSSWIIAGMNWCIANRIDVASMSLGGTSGPSVAYAQAIRRCQNANVTVVIASGNSFGSSFPWVCAPANSVITGSPVASPIAVGAVDRRCRIGSFSSRGGRSTPWNQVDVVAPGVSVNSTILNNRYGSKTGTSMACPHVTGAAALIKQRFRTISPLQIKARLQRTAYDLGRRGYDSTYGSGLINCDLATR